jgi:Na+/proline symporter
LVVNVLFLGKVQKIFKRRFHDKVPLGLHKRFWGWGTLALVWAQVLPLIFVAVAESGIDKLIDKLTEGASAEAAPPWGAILLSGPAILVFGFIVVFWAARGLAAVKFVMKYKPQDVGATPAPNRGGTARYRSTIAQ